MLLFICCHFKLRCQVAAKRSTTSAPTLVVICVQRKTFVAVELAANWNVSYSVAFFESFFFFLNIVSRKISWRVDRKSVSEAKMHCISDWLHTKSHTQWKQQSVIDRLILMRTEILSATWTHSVRCRTHLISDTTKKIHVSSTICTH